MIAQELDTAIGKITAQLMQHSARYNADEYRRVRDLLNRMADLLVHFQQHPEVAVKVTPASQINMDSRGDFPAGRE